MHYTVANGHNISKIKMPLSHAGIDLSLGEFTKFVNLQVELSVQWKFLVKNMAEMKLLFQAPEF